MSGSECAIVIATRNRAAYLLATIERLRALPERPEIVVVDNGGVDGTCELVAQRLPDVRLVRLEENIGAAARTYGVRATGAPYVAFCDDDCWWEPGSIARGVALLRAHPEVAVITARVLVRDEARLDEPCRLMECSPVRKRSACPGSAVLAFMAGACIVRREAFLAAGGYHPRYRIGAEESLLALDLAEAGWELVYNGELVVHHYPCDAGRDATERRRLVLRNRLWTVWLRRSPLAVARATGRLALAALHDAAARRALAGAFTGLPWIRRERRRIGAKLERELERLVELPA